MHGLEREYLGRMEAIGNWGLISAASMFQDYHDCSWFVINHGRGWEFERVGRKAKGLEFVR